MARVTRKDLDVTFGRLVRAAIAAKLIEADGWVLQHGSKTYGNSYGVWLYVEGVPGRHTVYGLDYLGMTASDAEHKMRGAIAAFELVAGAR